MRPTPIALVLGAVLLLACASSLSVGPEGLPFSGELLALGREDPALALTILTEIRLPRVVIGILVGGTLGLSGAALQGLLRNPLVEPGLIGVSSGATLGAVIAIYFGLSAQFALLLPLGGVLGALAALLVLFAVAGRDPGTLTLILAGVAIGSFATALTSLALNLAPSPFAALEIVFWMLGSLSDRSLIIRWRKKGAPMIAVSTPSFSSWSPERRREATSARVSSSAPPSAEGTSRCFG